MKNKKNILIVIGVISFCILVAGITYALYKFVIFDDMEVNAVTPGLDYYINYTRGSDLTGAILEPSSTYESGNSVDVEFWKIDDTYENIYGQIYLDIKTIGENISKEEALKYVLISSDSEEPIASGTLKGRKAGELFLIGKNIPLNMTSTTYTVYIYPSASGEPIDINVRCEATMVELD